MGQAGVAAGLATDGASSTVDRFLCGCNTSEDGCRTVGFDKLCQKSAHYNHMSHETCFGGRPHSQFLLEGDDIVDGRHSGEATMPSTVLRPPGAELASLVFSRARLFACHSRWRFGDLYEIKHQIGEGSFGNVFMAIAQAPPAQAGDVGSEAPPRPRFAAVKVFSLKPPEDKEPSAVSSLDEVQSRQASFDVETSVLARLEHPNIVRMYECFREEEGLYLVLEHCAGGELYARVVSRLRTGGFTELEVGFFLQQMLFATNYLHSRWIIHRDIKTENFLLLGQEGTPEAQIVKLCDFGTAVQLSQHSPRSMQRIGTLSYTAPEVYVNKGASFPSDVWSLGVVLYVLLVGANPFRWTGRETPEDTMRRICKGHFSKKRNTWTCLSSNARDLVQRLLVVQESQRLVCNEALCHAWVASGRPGLAAVGFFGGVDNTGLKASDASKMLLCQPTHRPASRSVAPQVIGLLSRFEHLDALQRLLLTASSRLSSEAELFRQQPGRLLVPWYALFVTLDTDMDGCLSYQELVGGLEALLGAAGPSPSAAPERRRLEALVHALDTDRSGSVEWSEWTALAQLAAGSLAEDDEPLCTTMRALDMPTCDGHICPKDLALLFGMGPLCERSSQEAARLLRKWAQPTKGAPATDPTLDISDIRRVLEDVPWGGLDDNGAGTEWNASIPKEHPKRYLNTLSKSPDFRGTVKLML